MDNNYKLKKSKRKIIIKTNDTLCLPTIDEKYDTSNQIQYNNFLENTKDFKKNRYTRNLINSINSINSYSNRALALSNSIRTPASKSKTLKLNYNSNISLLRKATVDSRMKFKTIKQTISKEDKKEQERNKILKEKLKEKLNLSILQKCRNIDVDYIEDLISKKKIKNEFYTPHCSITEKSKKEIKINKRRLKEKQIFNKIKESFHLMNNEIIRTSIQHELKRNSSFEDIIIKSRERIINSNPKGSILKHIKVQSRESFDFSISLSKNKKLILSNITESRLKGFTKIFNSYDSDKESPKVERKGISNAIRSSSIMARFLLKLEKPDEIIEDYVECINRPSDKYKRFKLQLIKKEKYLNNLLDQITETQNSSELEIKKFQTRLKYLFMRISRNTPIDLFTPKYKNKKNK